MKTRAWLWAGALALASAGAWAQAQGPGEGGPDGPPELADQPPPPGHRGMMPGEPRMAPGPRPAPLNEAQEGELLGFIKANEPMMAEHLEHAKSAMPGMYHHKLAEMWQMYKDPEARQQFAKTMKANRVSRELVEKYKEAQAPEKDALKEKIAKAVGDQFDIDVAGKELQIKKMQEQIAQLKEKITKRRQLKDKYVAQRVEKLTGEGDDWEW